METLEAQYLSLEELERFDPGTKGFPERRFLCPFCGPQSGHTNKSLHRSMAVNMAEGLFICHRCGAHGALKNSKITVSTEQKRSPIAKSRRTAILKPRRLLPEPNPESIDGYKRQVRKLIKLERTPGQFYLEHRGIPLELAVKSKVMYCPDWGRCGPSVIFPFLDENGKAIAASGRALTESGDITKQTFGPKSLGVFSTPGALDAERVALVEAPIDALTLALAGLPSIAIAGTAGFPEWLIIRFAGLIRPGVSRTVFIATDADSSGEKAAREIAKKLVLVETIRLVPPDCKDWNEYLLQHGWENLQAKVLEKVGVSRRLMPGDMVLGPDELRGTVVEVVSPGQYPPGGYVVFRTEDGHTVQMDIRELRFLDGSAVINLPSTIHPAEDKSFWPYCPDCQGRAVRKWARVSRLLSARAAH